jgi:hypothetical protein
MLRTLGTVPQEGPERGGAKGPEEPIAEYPSKVTRICVWVIAPPIPELVWSSDEFFDPMGS